jgi:basic amino acid/polyamine antiporter, APA family
LQTIEDQKINLVITNFDTYRNNKELQTLVTCPVLAMIDKATDDDIAYEHTDVTSRLQEPEEKKNPKKKKKMAVIYDDGDHSDLVLNVTRWFEHSGPFTVYVLLIKRKQQYDKGKERDHQEMIHQLDKQKRRAHLEQIGVEFKEIDLTRQITNDSEKISKLNFNAVNAYQPDLLVTSATVAKFNLFSNLSFLLALNNLNCPIIVARQFAVPGVHRLKYWLTKTKSRLKICHVLRD